MRNICTALGVVVVGVVVLSPAPAEAIPPFAREYGVPCSTCHITVTRRNEFGDAFRRAGYRWPTKLESDQEGRPIPPVEMRGASMLDGLLPARPPIGLIAYFQASATNDDNLEHKASFGNPSFNIVFGSNLGKHASIFGTVAGNGAPNELVGHFSRIANRPELNLRLGLIEQTTTLFKANESLLGGYLIDSINPVGHAVGTARTGAELNGVVGRRYFYALGAVQNDGPGSAVDGYYHLGAKWGGMNYRGDEPEIDFDNPSFWDDASVAVATWGYLGKVEDAGKQTGRVRRYGVDVQLNLPFGSLWGGAMKGFDRDLTALGPTLPANGLRIESLTWFGEASYRATSWLTAAYIFQFHDASNIAGKAMQSHDAGLVALMMDNLRIRLKFKYTPDDVKNESVDLQALIGF